MSSSNAFRQAILKHALPHVSEHSFTLRPLLDSLSTLPSNHPDRKAGESSSEVLDVVFGSELNARRELVQAWEEEGLRDMITPRPETSRDPVGGEMGVLAGILARRLEYSSRIGEHLVEASALLSSPNSSSSLPIPTKTLSILSSFLPKLPPLYRPPNSSFSPPPSSEETSKFFSSMLETSNNRIPLFRVNPLGPLSYAWKISDKAWYAVEKERGLKKGMNNEPVGAGPEWYIGRIGLGLVYLASESHLLQPPRDEVDQPDIRLQKALRTLDTNLKRYEQVMGTIESGEHRAGDMLGYMGFIGRAWAGIIRSRGF